MNEGEEMNDIIRKAVELADDEFFELTVKFCDGEFPDADQRFYDALAAQLVRQVDVTDYQTVIGNGSALLEIDDVSAPLGYRAIASVEGPDRTMNTLRAIVESGVLEND